MEEYNKRILSATFYNNPKSLYITRILLANAHLNNELMFEYIYERNEKKHKAPTPELYFDFEAVADECLKAREREVVRYIILLILALFALVCFFLANFGGILFAFFIAWVVEIITDINRKDYVRGCLKITYPIFAQAG